MGHFFGPLSPEVIRRFPLGSNMTDQAVPSGRKATCLAVWTAQRRTPSLWPEASHCPSGLKEQLRGPLYGSKSLCSLRHSRPVATSHRTNFVHLPSDTPPPISQWSSGLKYPKAVVGTVTSCRPAKGSQRR